MKIPKPNCWNYPLFLTIYSGVAALLLILILPIKISAAFYALFWVPAGALLAIPFDFAWRKLRERQDIKDQN